MNAREYFDTKPCTNPCHEHVVGNLVLQWQIANDKWTHITDGNTELTHWFRIGTVRNMQGQKLYEIVVGKLLIMFTFL